MATRTEHDSLGDVEVPAERYWGAQTERSRQNFPIGHEHMPLPIIHALARIKGAAAAVNHELGLLDGELAVAVANAAKAVYQGELDDEFPLVIFQTGSGTQSNMNVNEVIANRVSEDAGAARGSHKPAHPNDHVNMGQSSNDTFPSAMQIAACKEIGERLLPAVRQLRTTLSGKAQAYMDVVKIGRTHLQDATPITLGQEISGWAAQLLHAEQAIEAAMPAMLALPLGGTAVGTGIGTHPDFARKVIARVAADTGLPLAPMDNPFSGLAAHDACVFMSGALKQLACACMKIANDVRWLASGPRAGLGELTIPENEPGSSIMPGKVNPTQCEALTMVACQVMGNDAALGFAASQGNFELNVYKPLIGARLLESIGLLADGCRSFDERCARGIEPNRARLKENLERSLMLVTALSPVIGYETAAKVAHHAHEHGTSLREAVIALDVMSPEDFDAHMDPKSMTHPGR